MSDHIATNRDLPKLIQLAGPGVQSMEHDTPLYHLDIDKEQLDKLLVSPVEFFRRLGIGPDHGIARSGVMNVMVNGRIEAGTQWCCYVAGDTTFCHPH